MADNKTLFLALLLVIPAVAADPASRQPRKVATPSVSDVASYLDLAEARLEGLGRLIRCEAAPDEVDEALADYTRAFSRFHVSLGRLPADEQEPYFLDKLPEELRDQLAALRAVDEKVQRTNQGAVNEAVSHVQGALHMARGLAKKRGRTERIRFEPVLPEAPGPLDPSAGIPGFSQWPSSSRRWR